MKHRMLPFYLLTPSVFAVVSGLGLGLGLNFQPASGMEDDFDREEDGVARLKLKGGLSPVFEDNDEEGNFISVPRDAAPSNLGEVLTLSDIKRALNFSPDVKELINPPTRVAYQNYIESLMIKMMQFTGWKINPSSTFSSSYFYADESAVSEALKRERERVLTLKGREAQKLQIFISQMENLERFLKNTAQTSMPRNEFPSLVPDDIEKTTAWMGGASYLTHSTHLAFLVAPDAIEETLEIFSLLQKAFEKLQAAYAQLSTTLSAKVINPILKSRLLSTDRESSLQAWSQLLKANQDYYEKNTTADLHESITNLSDGREQLSISPPPSALFSDESSPAKKAEFGHSSIQEEGNSLSIDPLSPVSSEGDRFTFEMNENDEDTHVQAGVIAPSLETADKHLSASHPDDITVTPSPLAQAEITSIDHGSILDPHLDNEFDFTHVIIGPDGESIVPLSHEQSEDEDNFEHISGMPSAHLTDLVPAVGDLTSTAHPEHRPHPASPALGVQNDLVIPDEVSSALSSPSDILSVHAIPAPVSEIAPLEDDGNDLGAFEQVSSSNTASAPHSPARSSADSPVLVDQNDPVVPGNAADLSSPSEILSGAAAVPLVVELASVEDDENELHGFEPVHSSDTTASSPHLQSRSPAGSPALEVQKDESVSGDASSNSSFEPLSDTAVLPHVGEVASVEDAENDLGAFEQVTSSNTTCAPQSPARSSAGSPALEVQNDLSGPEEISPSDVLSLRAPTPVSGALPVEDADNELKEFEQVSSSNTASAPHSPARSLAQSPMHIDNQGQEIEEPSSNLLTPSSNIMPDAIISPPTVLQPQPLQEEAASKDTIAEDNKEDVVFVSTVDHESANRALAAQLAATLAEFEEFKRQAALQLSAAETFAQQQLEAEKHQRLMAEQATQQEKHRRLTTESFLSVDDRLQTQVALEMLENNVVQPIQDMINDFQEKVVAPILKSLDDLKSSFSENPEVDQTRLDSIRSNVEHIQKAGLESIQSVIDVFKSSFQESKQYLLEPTALLAKAHELVEKIVMAFKDTASPQKSAIESSVAPSETLQHFSYGPGLGLSPQIGMPLSFALIPQESTLLSVNNQTTPPFRIPTLGTASTSSSLSGVALTGGLPNTRGPAPSVGTTIQVLSSKAQEVAPAIRAWNAQMNRQFQTVHSSVQTMAAHHKMKQTRRRGEHHGILIDTQA